MLKKTLEKGKNQIDEIFYKYWRAMNRQASMYVKYSKTIPLNDNVHINPNNSYNY